MNMDSINERTSKTMSRLRDVVSWLSPETRFESTARAASSLAVASGFVALALTALARPERRVITLAVALGFFVLALSYLLLSKRWPALPTTFSVSASLLISVGVWADSQSWALGLVVYCLATMYAAYFFSPRGLALQLAAASGFSLIALIVAGLHSRVFAAQR
jgi:hypothetical protein